MVDHVEPFENNDFQKGPHVNPFENNSFEKGNCKNGQHVSHVDVENMERLRTRDTLHTVNLSLVRCSNLLQKLRKSMQTDPL